MQVVDPHLHLLYFSDRSERPFIFADQLENQLSGFRVWRCCHELLFLVSWPLTKLTELNLAPMGPAGLCAAIWEGLFSRRKNGSIGV